MPNPHVPDDFEALRAYVGAPNADDDFTHACWHEAVDLVTQFVDGVTVPDTILNRAYLECGSELYHRRSAPNGISQFASIDGSAIRISRDPLIGAKKTLEPFLGVRGIA